MVINIRTGEAYGKCLKLYSCEKVAWSGDSRGFFIYVRIEIGTRKIFILVKKFILKLFVQYDPEGRKKRHLYYHYLDGDKPDKLILKIKKADANTTSFKLSHDYKYLILRGSRMVSVANIKSLDREIRFDLIFKFSADITYVSEATNSNLYFQIMLAFMLFLLFCLIAQRNTLETMRNSFSSLQILRRQNIM